MVQVKSLHKPADLPVDRDWVLIEKTDLGQFHVWATARSGARDDSWISGPMSDFDEAFEAAKQRAAERGVGEIYVKAPEGGFVYEHQS